MINRGMAFVLCLLLLAPGLAWGVPVRTGTPIHVDLNNGNTGSTSVTVPADAQLMVCTVNGYASTGYFSTGGMTLAGAAFTMVSGGDASGSFWMGAGAYRVSPATGSQTLAWDWAGAGTATNDVTLDCSWYRDLDTASPVRASACTQQAGNPHATGSLTAQTGDLGVAFAYVYSESETTFTWTNATEVTEFTIFANSFGDSSLAEATPTGNVNMQANEAGGTTDGGICGVIVKPAAAGTPPAQRRPLVY